MTHARPRILVLNQYYWPGIEATAQLLAQLCEALVSDYEVTVVTGHLHGHVLPAEETRNGVRIVRVRSTAYDRARSSTTGRRTTRATSPTPCSRPCGASVPIWSSA